jgi:L,D-transpeptidase ErfK/SrfK
VWRLYWQSHGRAVLLHRLRRARICSSGGRRPSLCLSLLNFRHASLFLAIFALTATAEAAALDAPEKISIPVRHEISGEQHTYQVTEDDTSESIAARIGEPVVTLFPDGSEPEPGRTITIDNRHVAAAAVDQGIVINVPQRMLFAFKGGRLIGAWPITAGRPDWQTPIGSYQIASLSLNPTWHVPPAIRAEMEEEGIRTSVEVKPGPDNPLGNRWIGLDRGDIGIHGTNHPSSIFHFGSHGCIRLAPESIDLLFRMVTLSERVEIVYQPVALAALDDGRIFLESDTDPYERGRPDLGSLHMAARTAGLEDSIDWPRASRTLVTVEGIARRIDRRRKAEAAADDGAN